MLYARLSGVWVRGGAVGAVQSVRVVAMSEEWSDVVVIVRREQRCTAIGLRLRRTPRGWLIDDVALPEHGSLPLPPYPVAGDDPEDPDEGVVPPGPERVTGPATGRHADWFSPGNAG
jgi:hypothetical protein